MSSTTTSTTLIVAAAIADMETLALIDAYCERWYVLRRWYRRTANWDAVAAIINSRFSDASIPKTPTQCRHKMENRTDPPSANTRSGDKIDNSTLLKTFLDQSILKLMFLTVGSIYGRSSRYDIR
ncbi:trihelix transcription factor ASIL1-like [Forsythia ovata]|uniref:Trihelix transcription factor ASIL1-like n=1 Tax=Forsythia ovata TaxID=205694 RepID=A0ABD1RIT3_9LAMI